MMEFLKTRAFPDFYKDYAPKLIEFFGQYIDFLNEPDNAAYMIDHLSSNNDIDESVDFFLNKLKKELAVDFPERISTDLRLLLKNIFYFYNSKSSVSSYEFLFRAMFDSTASLSYPKEYILKTSDGRWYYPTCIKTGGFATPAELFRYSGYKVTGKSSYATGYFDSVQMFNFDGDNNYEDCIALTNVEGDFSEGEEITFENPEDGTIVPVYVTVERYGQAPGKWKDTYGFLSSDRVIQDSNYYQDFSYVIKSYVTIRQWYDTVKTLIHPAGLKFFSNVLLHYEDDIVMNLPPMTFLRFWRLVWWNMFFNEAQITQKNMGISFENIAQNRSETWDEWSGRGTEIDQPRLSFDTGKTDEISTLFNRCSILLFMDSGNIVNPKDVDFWHMELKNPIEDTRHLFPVQFRGKEQTCFKKGFKGNVFKPEFPVRDEHMVFLSGRKMRRSEYEIIDGDFHFPEEISGDVLIISPGDDFIRERHTVNQSKEFTFDRKVSKDYILLFLDGKFSRNFEISGKKIIYPETEHVEIFVLHEIDRNAIMPVRYYSDQKFVLWNMMKKHHMASFTDIHKFSVFDLVRDDMEHNCGLEWFFLKLLEEVRIQERHDIIKGFCLAQNWSESFEEIMDNPVFQTYNFSSSRAYEARFNSDFVLVFDNHRQIPQENIDWKEKRLCIPLNCEWIYAIQTRATNKAILDHVMGESYTPRIPEAFISKNFWVFVDGQKVSDDRVFAENGKYIFSDPQAGVLNIFSYGPGYIQERKTTDKKAVFSHDLQEDHILVFADGWFTRDFIISGKEIEVFGDFRNAEIFVLGKMDSDFVYRTAYKPDGYLALPILVKNNIAAHMSDLVYGMIQTFNPVQFEIHKNITTQRLNQLWDSIVEAVGTTMFYAPQKVQNHSDTLASIIHDGGYSAYSFVPDNMLKVQAKHDRSSTMLFTDSGLLISPEDIDFRNQLLTKDYDIKRRLYGISISALSEYVAGNSPVTVANQKVFVFANSLKIPDQRISRNGSDITNPGKLTVFSYGERLIQKRIFTTEKEIALDNHVTKNEIMVFLDGKFNWDDIFVISGNTIKITATFNEAEIYIFNPHADNSTEYSFYNPDDRGFSLPNLRRVPNTDRSGEICITNTLDNPSILEPIDDRFNVYRFNSYAHERLMSMWEGKELNLIHSIELPKNLNTQLFDFVMIHEHSNQTQKMNQFSIHFPIVYKQMDNMDEIEKWLFTLIHTIQTKHEISDRVIKNIFFNLIESLNMSSVTHHNILKTIEEYIGDMSVTNSWIYFLSHILKLKNGISDRVIKNVLTHLMNTPILIPAKVSHVQFLNSVATLVPVQTHINRVSPEVSVLKTPETTEFWKQRGSYRPNSLGTISITEFEASTNNSSTLMFSSGKLILPENIDWLGRQFITLPDSEVVHAVVMNPDMAMIPGTMSGTTFQANDDTFIPNNFWFFLDGVKMFTDDIETSNYSYIFKSSKNGKVNVFGCSDFISHTKEKVLKKTEFAVSVKDKSKIMIFVSGLLYTDFKLEQGKVILGTGNIGKTFEMYELDKTMVQKFRRSLNDTSFSLFEIKPLPFVETVFVE